MQKSANHVDVAVGQRIRFRRMLIQMTQGELAERVGITFQQIQKYEKGINRVGASRLYQVAQVLRVPVQYFFEDFPTNGGDNDFKATIDDFLSNDGLELNRSFSRITSPKARKAVVALAKALSE